MIEEKKAVERWINEDPKLREYITRAQDLYKGPIRFVRTGRRKYQAKLDCEKLHGCGKSAKEAYFELNLAKKKAGSYKDFFYLKIITSDYSINTIKLF